MENVAIRFKALSEETRLRILKLLEDGELCVCDIAAALEMTQPNISFHLAILKEAGFIKDRRVGRWIHYELDLSSTFNKILLPTALGGMKGKLIGDDKGRLAAFIESKAGGSCAATR
jgi:ArsR family transcriptional regulator, arsenate/arsenite/antimonite-responsive transcriptional repressor